MRRSQVRRMADGAPVGLFAARFSNPMPVSRPEPRVWRVCMAESGWTVAAVIAESAAQAVRFARERDPVLAASPCPLKAEVA